MTSADSSFHRSLLGALFCACVLPGVGNAQPAAGAPAATLPASVPPGVYACVTYGSTNASVGKLRIISSNASSGVTPDGSGPQHRYAYDAATGSIAWAEGMKVAGWTVEQALYRPTKDGKPNINLHYRLRAGGNLNSMSCQVN